MGGIVARPYIGRRMLTWSEHDGVELFKDEGPYLIECVTLEGKAPLCIGLKNSKT